MASKAGNWFTFVAAYAVIKELSAGDVALHTAIFLICRRLPYLLLFPVTGLAADRLNRGALLVGACLVQGAISFTLPVVRMRGDVRLLYPLILLQYSAQAFYDPARIAAIPTVIPSSLLCVAGTLDLSGFSLMALFGAAMAGHTAAVYGTSTCFRVEGFAFMTAAALMLRLALRGRAAAPKAPHAAAAGSATGTSSSAAGASRAGAVGPAISSGGSTTASAKGPRISEGGGAAAAGSPEGSHSASRQSFLSAAASVDPSAFESPPELQPFAADVHAPVHTVKADPWGSSRAEPHLPHASAATLTPTGKDDESRLRGRAGRRERGRRVGCGGCGALQFLVQRRNWDVAVLIWGKATGAMVWGAADVLNGRFSQMQSMQALGGPDQTLGLILVAVGFGSVAGPMIANGLTPGVARFWRLSIARAFLLLLGGYSLMAAAGNVYLVLPATVIRTTGSATIWVHSMAIMQHRLHEGIRGRLVALEFVLYTVSESGSTLFGGYVMDSLGWSTRTLCLVLGGLAGVFSAGWFLNAWLLWDGPSTYLDREGDDAGEEGPLRQPLLVAEEEAEAGRGL